MLGFFKRAFTKTDKIERERLEELLLEADIAYDIVEPLIESLPSSVSREKLRPKLLELLNSQIKSPESTQNERPFVELIIGINGAGKTTTIAKLTHRYTAQGAKVLLGAADTFRAAAIEQLRRWATRLNVDIVATQQDHDPSAVAYDTVSKALAKGYDHVIIDTAGRLHTQNNLANELKKIVRVIQKAMPSAPHRKLLVLDGTQGSSAIAQAHAFHEMVAIDGIIITKLDGTAKGGALFSIAAQSTLPILYIGVGEGVEDLRDFEPEVFVDSLLDAMYL
ncbi:MAG: cell division protein FtsY [Sulfuricurvum sp. PC08-66]|nr:MAG: cell division protein FtsY [Sulfuricurvum sp. PC08-66]